MNHVMASNQTRSCSAGRAARISGAVSLVLASGCWLLSPAATRADTPPAVIGRVPLTAADAADMIEAPSILIDAGGTLHATWVSEMASGERTVFVADAPAGEPLSQPRMVARTGIFVAESTMGGRGGPPATGRLAL